MKIRCYLVGHTYDPEAARYGYFDCDRCGHSDQAEVLTPGHRIRAWFDVQLFRMRMWWFSRRYRTRNIHCRDCGAWFGRHDNTKCIPF